jgi:O-methyltransferase
MRDWRAASDTFVYVREYGETAPVWEDDQPFVELYNDVQFRSFVSPYRLYVIYNLARHANNLPGQFAQVGVYRGGSAKLISRIKIRDKKLFLFDTFRGLPQPAACDRRFSKGEFGDVSESEVREYLEGDPSVVLTTGVFPQSAPRTLDEESFCFVYLDVDIYSSNYEALSFFYPRMVSGGVIVLDDYGLSGSGVRQSTDEFLLNNSAVERPVQFTRFQAVIFRA